MTVPDPSGDPFILTGSIADSSVALTDDVGFSVRASVGLEFTFVFRK